MGRTHGTRIWSWARTRMVELPYCPSEVAVRHHLRRPGGLRPVGCAPLGNRHETLQRGVHRRQEPDRIFTGRIHDSLAIGSTVQIGSTPY